MEKPRSCSPNVHRELTKRCRVRSLVGQTEPHSNLLETEPRSFWRPGVQERVRVLSFRSKSAEMAPILNRLGAVQQDLQHVFAVGGGSLESFIR